jgi:hypothetical protein
VRSGNTPGSGGAGGGGNGSAGNGPTATAGGTNTGGGGGGGANTGSIIGAAGGSGIVIARFPGSTCAAVAPGTNTLATLPAPAGGCKVATFTVSGTLTIN